MIKLWRFLSVSVVLAVCLGLMLVPAMTSAQPAAGKVGIEAESGGSSVIEVGLGGSFDVNITVLNPNSVSVGTGGIHMTFDPGLINVTGIDKGDWDNIVPLSPWWDNSTGDLCFEGYNNVGHFFTTDFLHCTIHLVSTGVSGQSELNFVSYSAGPPTNAKTRMLNNAIPPADVLDWDAVQNATVRIGSPTLTVNVTPADKGTVKADGVTLTDYPNTTTRSWDDVVQLNATTTVPNWTFDHWSGDLNGSTNPTSITMDDNKNVTAHFAAVGGGATLEGNVDLQGLPATNVTVRFFAPNTTTEYVAMKTHTITDSDGNFTIDNIDPGSYDVAVKGSTSLSNLESGVNLTAGETTYTDFGVLLEGDASGDDYVDGSDFGPLSDAWLSYPGCPKGNWDATVDFSRDNYIDGSDFGPLSDDWLKWGDCFGWPGSWT